MANIQLRPDVVLGVDGGRSKTIALIADTNGQVLGAGRVGDATHSTSDLDKQMEFILAAVEEAGRDADIDLKQVIVSFFGLSGADWPEDHQARWTRLANFGAGRQVGVKNDAFLHWRAALSQYSFGVVIAAGTGANIGVIAPDGREWHYGAYARSGGAQSMGLEALTAVFRAADGRGEFTALTQVVLDKLDMSSTDDLLHAEVERTLFPPDVFGLAPHVMKTANEGDEVATAIVVGQAKILAEYATAAIRRFSMETYEFDVVLSGGFFRSQNHLLLETIAEEVQRIAPQVHFLQPNLEPVMGALLYAYDDLEIAVSQEIVVNLTNTTPPATLFDTRSDAKQVDMEDSK